MILVVVACGVWGCVICFVVVWVCWFDGLMWYAFNSVVIYYSLCCLC